MKTNVRIVKNPYEKGTRIIRVIRALFVIRVVVAPNFREVREKVTKLLIKRMRWKARP